VIDLDVCKKILNANSKAYSNEEVIAIRDFLNKLAEIVIDTYYDNKEFDSETGSPDVQGEQR
jgi:hypothetical protein